MLPIKNNFSCDRISKCPIKQQSSLHANYIRSYFKKFGVSSNHFPNVCPERLSKALLCRYALSQMLSSYTLCWQLCAFKDRESGPIIKNQKIGLKTSPLLWLFWMFSIYLFSLIFFFVFFWKLFKLKQVVLVFCLFVCFLIIFNFISNTSLISGKVFREKHVLQGLHKNHDW